MTNRSVGAIIRDQQPIVLGRESTVREACERMCERRAGSVLVADDLMRLVGIFTGRDAVRLLSRGEQGAATTLAEAMTRNPMTLGPDARAIDALRLMCDGGFRHVPVVERNRILGVVSRGDFRGMEIDRIDEEERLWECVR